MAVVAVGSAIRVRWKGRNFLVPLVEECRSPLFVLVSGEASALVQEFRVLLAVTVAWCVLTTENLREKGLKRRLDR